MRWILGWVFLVLGAADSAGLEPAPRAGSREVRPNLILILSDDHRWDVLGIAGNEKAHTPELDQLAREGLYLSQATIHVSQCPPSRATLLTGLPPHVHGMHSLQYREPRAETAETLCAPGTLPSLLRDAGYKTGLVGKWHLVPEPWECGFSEVGTWIPAGAAPFKDPDRMARGKSRKLRKIEGYTQEILVEEALSFIARYQKGRAPYFLWLALTAPHLPYAPNPPRIEKLYAGKKPADLLPPGFPAEDEVHPRWVEYYEAVSHMDEQIGRLLRGVRKDPSGRRTVVVFLGDNGYMMGEKGMGLVGPAGKVVPWEGSLRVPFMIAGVPGLEGESSSPVSSLDLPPTLLALGGVRAPAHWPGRDLVAALQGGGKLPEAISEWSDDQSEPFGALAYRVLRTDRYKLIDWQSEDRADELYDFLADPHENRDLSRDPDHAVILEDLRHRLREWRRKTKDPGLPNSPR